MVATLLPMPYTPTPAALSFIESCKARVAEARQSTPKLTQDQAYAIIAEVFDNALKSQRKRKPVSTSKMTDDEWVEWLESQEVYKGIDVRREIGKCQVWFRGNKPSRQRIVNWLNKADPTVGYNGVGKTSSSRNQPAQTLGPAGWQEWINANLPESAYAVGGNLYPASWGGMDTATQAHIRRSMGL